MTRRQLRERLAEVVRSLAGSTFEECLEFRDQPVHEEFGVPGSDEFYQVTVRLLENESSYRRLHVAVDDGRGFLGIVRPVTGTVIVHRDGRVETDPTM